MNYKGQKLWLVGLQVYLDIRGNRFNSKFFWAMPRAPKSKEWHSHNLVGLTTSFGLLLNLDLTHSDFSTLCQMFKTQDYNSVLYHWHAMCYLI